MRDETFIRRIRKPGTALAAVPALLALLVAPAAGFATVGERLESAGLEMATQVATDPVSFLFDMHLNSQDRTPLPVGKAWQIGLPFFPNLLPFASLGLGGKGQVHREHGGWPQIDIFGGGWDSIPLMAVSSTEFDGVLYGYHLGFVVTESLDPQMRIFAGYEFTQMRVDLDFAMGDDEPVDPADIQGFDDFQDSFEKIRAANTEHFLFAGTELLRTPTKRFVAEVGYGIVNAKTIFRLTWSSKTWDTGLAFYPEAAWIIWPQAHIQVRF